MHPIRLDLLVAGSEAALTWVRQRSSAASFGPVIAKSACMPRLFVLGFFLVMLLWSMAAPALPSNLTMPAAMPPAMQVSHVTTTELSSRQFTLETILGQPAHTWMRRLVDGLELDGAVFEVAEARTAQHHIYVVHVVPHAEF